MNILSYHEEMQRGTPDFPAELYTITKSHPRYKMQSHWHKDFEIIHISRGKFELNLNGESFGLAAGESMLIPGGIIHGGEPEECSYECIVFAPTILYAVPACRRAVKKYVQQPVRLPDSADKIFEVMKKKGEGYELSATACLYGIFSWAAANAGVGCVLPDKRLEKIKAAISLIEDNYSRKITLRELADTCSMSPNYFSRFFREMTGQTPFEYIVTYRIEAACELLCGGDSVTDVCYSCGFNDLSYFIHIFKKHKNMPPKAYSKLYSKMQ